MYVSFFLIFGVKLLLGTSYRELMVNQGLMFFFIFLLGFEGKYVYSTVVRE